MPDDAELLRRYAESHSEAAFAELVQRRLNLVYSIALRQVGGDPHFASDVTQRVFADLATKASSLSRRPVLTGWLYRRAQFAASDLVRSERRRRAREQEAHTMQELTHESAHDAGWQDLRPVIDEAMGELSGSDRDAVMLRFFEERPFAEIGAALQLTEDAARMRVERALEKLQGLLKRRGVTSTSVALGMALANQGGIAAPAGLAASVTSLALSGAATASIGSALALFMSTKTATAAGVVLLLGAAIYFGRDGAGSEPLHSVSNVSRTSQPIPFNPITRASGPRAESTQPAAAPAASQPSSASIPRQTVEPTAAAELRTRIGHNLRQIAAAAEQFLIEQGRLPASIDELVGPGKLINSLVRVAGEDYKTLSLVPGETLSVTTSHGVTATHDFPVRSDLGPLPARPALTPGLVGSGGAAEQAAERLGPERMQSILVASKKAADAYRAANNGKAPPNLDALLPYFGTLQEGADFVEYLNARKLPR